MLIGIYLISFYQVLASTECVWATGTIVCNKNQSRVVGSVVSVYDLDSPQDSDIKNPFDPDDKVGFTLVEDNSGLFMVEGCASDQDWIPGIKNKPEFYFKVHHFCNSDVGELKTVLPVFRVYTPQTYDYHIQNPIQLD